MSRWIVLTAVCLSLSACQAGSGDGNAAQRAEDASGTAAPTPPAPDEGPAADAPPPTAPAQSSGSQSR